jgi:BioD-like phosphotransacetylase family protein
MKNIKDKINAYKSKKRIELYDAFRDGERNQIRKYIIKQMEDIGIHIKYNKKFIAEYKERKKEVEEVENKYKLNEEEQRIWHENNKR